MSIFTLRHRVLTSGKTLYGNSAGHFFASENSRQEKVTWPDLGSVSNQEQSLIKYSNEIQTLARDTQLTILDYLVLVPTLRCDLNCSYCQVSRANENAKGFDWSEKTLEAVLLFIDTLMTDSIKVEFQGGEPTLRLDLLKAVIDRCERFTEKQFVICTNLSKLTPDFLELIKSPDIVISTSLDGNALVHKLNRTETDIATNRFFDNLDYIISEYGPSKVSALPTINQESPPDIDSLINEYAKRGICSIHLRPINYQGFARKRHKNSQNADENWFLYYHAFALNIIERNFKNRHQVLEESYLSLCLRRIFRIGLDRHVDLRNPNPVGVDYALIDFDGKVYPTDEARMLTRSGVIDLAIGDVWTGFDTVKRRTLDTHSTNHGDPVCDKCIYQPYCGRDLIDDLSRYSRIDLPRDETAFCKKHIDLFDFCYELIYSEDPKVRYSLARWLGISGEYLPKQRMVP